MPATTENDDLTLPFVDSFTLAEAEMISEMCQAGGHGTFQSVVRTALYKYAVHLDLKPDVDVFKLRDGRKKR